MNTQPQPMTVEGYIAAAPKAVQPVLREIRAIIQGAAPDALETIAYGMPAYKGRHILVYFGAHKKHLGFYPTPNGIEQFKNQLKPYKPSKGAVQFPYNRPLPWQLIAAIVKYRVEEDQAIG